MVVHAQGEKSKHGKYADPDQRKAYRHEWMKAQRAKLKTP